MIFKQEKALPIVSDWKTRSFKKISRTGEVTFTVVNSMSMTNSAIFRPKRRMTNIFPL